MSFLKMLSAATALTSVFCAPAMAQLSSFKVLHTFTGGADGGQPMGALATRYGSIEGTTSTGGTGGAGTIFTMNATTGAETVQYNYNGGTDGSTPESYMELDGKYLYGTTEAGGTSNAGTIFKVNPKTGTGSVVYSFTGGADGGSPRAGLVLSGGFFWGTTYSGGTSNDGTIYKIDPKTGAETTVYSFSGTADGANPYCDLIAIKGVLYGGAELGGATGVGTLFSYNTATGTETTLHAFTFTDGAFPYGRLVYVGGSLYGTSNGGGASYKGTVFGLNVKTSALTTLYSFAGGNDGANPVAGLTNVGTKLYGTTQKGGSTGYGTVFVYDLSASAYTSLYTFTGGTDGGYPWAGLVQRKGVFYGATEGSNGTTGDSGVPGAIFTFKP